MFVKSVGDLNQLCATHGWTLFCSLFVLFFTSSEWPENKPIGPIGREQQVKSVPTNHILFNVQWVIEQEN